MGVFAVRLQDNKTAKKFLAETVERMSSPDLLSNPFESPEVRGWNDGEDLIAVLKLNPIYPNPFGLAFLTAALVFFLTVTFGIGWAWLSILPILLFSFSFTYTDLFFSMVLRAGLRKNGYDGKFTKLKTKELLEEGFEQWDNKKFLNG